MFINLTLTTNEYAPIASFHCGEEKEFYWVMILMRIACSCKCPRHCFLEIAHIQTGQTILQRDKLLNILLYHTMDQNL